MNKIIRNETFETNSSSTHSYTFIDGCGFGKNVNYLYISGGTYGWQNDILEHVNDKMDYVVQYFYDLIVKYDTVFNDNQYDEEFKNVLAEIVIRNFIDYCKSNHYNKNLEIETDFFTIRNDGYVDHQSIDLFLDKFKFEKDGFNLHVDFSFFFDLIFGENNTITLSNDN